MPRNNSHLSDALHDLAQKFGVNESITGSYLLENYNKLAFYSALKTQNGRSRHSDGFINSWKYYVVPPSHGKAIWMRYLKRNPNVLCWAGPGLRKRKKRKVASEGSENSSNEDLSSSDSDFIELIPTKDRDPSSRKQKTGPLVNNESPVFMSSRTTPEPPRKRLRDLKADRDALTSSALKQGVSQTVQGLKCMLSQYRQLKEENLKLENELANCKKKVDTLCVYYEGKLGALHAALADFKEEHHELLLTSTFGGKGGVATYTFRFRSSKLEPESEHYECLKNFKKVKSFVPKQTIEGWVAEFRLKNYHNAEQPRPTG